MLKTILQSLSPNTTLCLAIDLSLPTETILRKTIQQWQRMLTSSELDPLNLDKRPAVFLLSAEP
jgi:16S rRNA (cytidine1402-2'-O)-methyltransferase